MAVADNGRPLSFPNQKLIRKYETKHDETHIYFYQSKKAIFTAIKELSHGGLALYLYLNSNQAWDKGEIGYVQALSPVAVKNAIGLSESSYRRGVKELIEKGYLIPDIPSDTISVNYYFFWEDPDDWRSLKGGKPKEEETMVSTKTDSSITKSEAMKAENMTTNQILPVNVNVPETIVSDEDCKNYLASLC